MLLYRQAPRLHWRRGYQWGVQVTGLDSIDHVVLVMLENRSFDHMLGFLYPKSGNFDGLDGTESNLAADGSEVKVFPITPDIQNAYYFPLANPAEGYKATNDQLFSSDTPPASGEAANDGFVTSFASELQHPAHPLDPKLVGAVPASIMGMYAAETLPVLSGLAKGFAVCDGWFASVPTQTFPNRAFAVAGTSLGYVDNSARGLPAFNTPSVFGKLADAGQTWKIYGYSGEPLTSHDFPDTVQPGPNGEVVSGFARFQSDAANGNARRLLVHRAGVGDAPPDRPARQPDDGHNWHLENDQHPISNLAIGEKLLYDVYQALQQRPSLGKDPAHHHLRRARRQLRPRAPADGGDRTGQRDRLLGVRLHAFRSPGTRGPRLSAHPGRHDPARAQRRGHPSTTPRSSRPSALVSASGRSETATPPLPDVGSILTLATPRTDDPLAGLQPPTARTRSSYPAHPPSARPQAPSLKQMPWPLRLSPSRRTRSQTRKPRCRRSRRRPSSTTSSRSVAQHGVRPGGPGIARPSDSTHG